MMNVNLSHAATFYYYCCSAFEICVTCVWTLYYYYYYYYYYFRCATRKLGELNCSFFLSSSLLPCKRTEYNGGQRKQEYISREEKGGPEEDRWC